MLKISFNYYLWQPFAHFVLVFTLSIKSISALVHWEEKDNDQLAVWNLSIVIVCPSEKVTLLYLQTFKTTHILTVLCRLCYLLSSSHLILSLPSVAQMHLPQLFPLLPVFKSYLASSVKTVHWWYQSELMVHFSLSVVLLLCQPPVLIVTRLILVLLVKYLWKFTARPAWHSPCSILLCLSHFVFSCFLSVHFLHLNPAFGTVMTLTWWFALEDFLEGTCVT